MEAIIEQLPVGVLITDNHGMLVQRNKKLDQILGLKIPVGFKIGEDNLQNVKIDGKVINPKQSVLSHALQNGRVVGKEYAYERPDGKHVSLTVSSSVIRRQDGEIIAAASIVNDITAQKEMEARKDDFVNMASHELKTPITSLKIYIGYLIKKVGATNETNILKTLRSIQYQTEKLQEIVNSLLDVSRLQTGKLTFNKEKFDICELLQETVESLQGATNKQRLVYESHKPLIVFADKFRTYQVITNLITNAIKYSKQATDIKIKVKKSGGKAQVSVKDYGIGIEEGQHKKIFDKLYQVTTDTEKTFPGFGMGLYISREIIKRHRGSIWVESEKGKGSTFHFTLPLA
jgi:PAS domain S-box-containing protein